LCADAVLILHGTGGAVRSSSAPNSAVELFGPGQALDATKYFLILPDGRAWPVLQPATACTRHFPRYGYIDMIAPAPPLTEGAVNHLRLVMGNPYNGSGMPQ